MTAPVLSVVLPCLNEASHLEGSLAVVRRVLGEVGLPFELVVVDDGAYFAKYLHPTLLLTRKDR